MMVKNVAEVGGDAESTNQRSVCWVVDHNQSGHTHLLQQCHELLRGAVVHGLQSHFFMTHAGDL